MANFFYACGNVTRRIRLSDRIGEGASGTIHRVVGEPGLVAKLYKQKADLPEYSEKIQAMLASPPKNLPPCTYNGRTFVQIAWPVARIVDDSSHFVGFVMPEVDFQSSTELGNILQRSTRHYKQLPEFYGGRVLLAANLSALVAELHAQGHYMVDMKPTNMRFYPAAWQIAILDTDGFSINGDRRFPSLQFSDEYIAPEAKKLKPEQLGLEQDLFALAVINFRLLNNGIHPFQGVDQGNGPTTLQERIFGGLYPYDISSHSNVTPVPSSIHEFFEDQTRMLFDRAFTKQYRPTATEWRDHLTGLISNHVLVRCHVNDEHAHFSKGCGFCDREQRIAANVQAPATVLNYLPKAKPIKRGAPSIPNRASLASTKRYRAALTIIASTIIVAGYMLTGKPSSQNSPIQSDPTSQIGQEPRNPLARGVQESPGRVQGSPNGQGGREPSRTSQTAPTDQNGPAQPAAGSNSLAPNNSQTPPARPVNVKISLGKSLEDGVLRSAFSGTAVGPKTTVAAKVSYQSQGVGQAQIVMKSPEWEWECPQEPTKQGKSELRCKFPEPIVAGDYKVAFVFDGSVVDEKSFRVVNPKQGSGCQSQIYTASEGGQVWAKSCSVGAGHWRYWCSNGNVFDYLEDDPSPPNGLQTNCADTTDPGNSIAPANSQDTTQIAGATIAGTWKGTYYLASGHSEALTFNFDANGCDGHSQEPNPYAPAQKLVSTLRYDSCGRTLYPGQTVIFTKTYDGSAGGLPFSVVYTGTVSNDLQQISGVWRVSAEAGNFTMNR